MELSEIAQTTCLIAVSHEHFMKMHDSDAFQWFELFWAMGFVHLHWSTWVQRLTSRTPQSTCPSRVPPLPVRPARRLQRSRINFIRS